MDCVLKLIYEPKTKLYKLDELNKTEVPEIERTDHDITSSRNRIIKSSIWTKPKTQTKKVLLILNGNMGNKLSALYLLKHFIPKDISVAILEYNGRGYSERLPISYTYHEKNDINIFIEFLNKKFGYKNFALWGRSMGGATALAYYEKFHFRMEMERDYFLRAIVVDSPFLNFENVLDTKLKGMFFVSMFAGRILEKIKNRTKDKYDFAVEDIDIFGEEIKEKKNIKNKIPFRVIGSPEDELCKFKYVEEFYKLLDGDKELIKVDGNHAKDRDIKIIEGIVEKIIHELSK